MAEDGQVEQDVSNDKLKGRCDLIIPGRKLVIDWKSTQHINPDYIASDIKKYHYDTQSAIYSQLTGGSDVVLFFVEKSEPYDCLPVVIEPGSATMRNGAAKLNLWYNQAKRCFENNDWGGLASLYPDGFMWAE